MFSKSVFYIASSLMFAIMLFSCRPSTEGYSCINGNCIPIADNAEYFSLDQCVANCDTANIGYNCVNGNCIQVERDSAQYWYLNQCIDSCQ